MSRIDEALKRASADASPRREATEAPDSHAGEPALDRFPVEAHPATEARFTARPAALAGVRARLAQPAPPSQVVLPESGKLVVGASSDTLPGEQYRRLAATMHDMQAERGIKTLMVTSAVPQEGKTLTITNLALTLSDSYARRVLLIDADLRRPGVHQLLGLANDQGLSEVLSGDRREAPVVHVSPRLDVLLAGRPTSNPLAGLVSDRMRTLVEDCESRYDWVLIDTPPVGVMAEAQLLARVTHGVIFVIKAGATPFAAVERAVSELGRDAIVGTVLNGAEERAIPTVAYYREYAEK